MLSEQVNKKIKTTVKTKRILQQRPCCMQMRQLVLERNPVRTNSRQNENPVRTKAIRTKFLVLLDRKILSFWRAVHDKTSRGSGSQSRPSVSTTCDSQTMWICWRKTGIDCLVDVNRDRESMKLKNSVKRKPWYLDKTLSTGQTEVEKVWEFVYFGIRVTWDSTIGKATGGAMTKLRKTINPHLLTYLLTY